MRRPRAIGPALVLAILCPGAAAPAGEAAPAIPFKAQVHMKTFMEHVLTPAAKLIWSVNAIVVDENGEHDLSPKSDADWEQIVSGAAMLAEATNALMIPQRARDREWNAFARRLAEAADKAYVAAGRKRVRRSGSEQREHAGGEADGTHVTRPSW